MATAVYEFRLADVGEGLHEAEVKRWLVQPGDSVALDQPLVEIETDKAVVELPSPVAGVVASLGAEEGAILHVGEIVAVLQPSEADASYPPSVPTLSTSDRSTPAGSAAEGPARDEMAAAHTAGMSLAQPSIASARSSDQRALATPAVRKLARERGVDINRVPGSGPGGRVLAEDVETVARGGGSEPPTAVAADPQGQPGAARALSRDGGSSRVDTEPAPSASQPAPGPPPAVPRAPGGPPSGETRLPLRGLRRRIAQTMVQAWSTIPHITGFDEVEVAALVALRERLKPVAAARGLRLSYLPFIVKAVALALREQPMLNASLDEANEEIVLHGAVNIGIATATPDGLIVPVLKRTEEMTLLELQRAIDGLTERARARTATPDELHGGTFTITNFGALGGWQAAPIIRPGEAAILGVGRIQQRPWVVDGRVEPRPVLALSLAADHRLVDGDVSTAFLARVGALLAEPGLMLLEMR